MARRGGRLADPARLNLSAIVVGGVLTLGIQKARQDRLVRQEISLEAR